MKRDLKQHITLVAIEAKNTSLGSYRPVFYSDYKLVPPYRE
ncbi:hypothetical protein [Flavobacterium sp. NRK F10]|nr:hypothetical protein [Flavobacterium sp. NRK F10]